MIDQHNSLAEKFIKKGFWLYLFSFIIAPMGYVIKIIISSDLNVEEVGVIYGIMSLITLVSAFSDFGMKESLSYYVPKYFTENRYDKVKTILFYAFVIQLFTGLIVFLLFIFGANSLAIDYFHSEKAASIIKIFAFFFLGINLFQLINTFFLSIQNTLYQKITELIRMIFILISVVSIFFLDIGSIENYSYSWVIGLYLGVVFTLIIFYMKYYKTYLKGINIIYQKKLFIEIIKYALIVFLGAQAGTILSQIDMQMVIYLLGSKSAGYYTNYLSIINIPFIIIGPVFMLLFPVFSELHAKGEVEKIKIVKSVFQKNFLVLSIGINIIFFVFSTVIATILFGEKFYESGVILQYSILFLVFNVLLQINNNIMGAIGKIKERLKIILIAIVFNIILNYILINLIGIYGAALATGFGWILIWALTEYKLNDYRVRFHTLYILKNLLFLGAIGFILNEYIVKIFDSTGRVQGLILLSGIIILYFIILFIFNYNEFKYFVSEIKKIKQ